MASAWEFPSPFEDPGGGSSSQHKKTGNKIDGTYAGRTLPDYMDPRGENGDLTMLKMEGVSGTLPKHPFLLRTSVERFINGKIVGAFPEARGMTYALKVRNNKQVEKLLQMAKLDDGTAIKISKHPRLNTSRCVVSCRDTVELSDNDIKKALEDQKVTEIRRITRRNGEIRENTPTIILTIEGTVPPPHIDIGWLRCRTRPYYPAPMMCFGCYNFGHTRARCQQKETTCGHCSTQHVVEVGGRCPNDNFCSRCKNNSHPLSSRNCPVYKTENEVQRIRVDEGISYPAAKRLFEQSNNNPRSYANITTASKDHTIAVLEKKVEALEARLENTNSDNTGNASENNNSKLLNELLRKVDALTKEVMRKDERIRALEIALAKQGNQEGQGNRMELTRKHGTIEDLVAKVNRLEAEGDRKSKELEWFRKIYGSPHTTESTSSATTANKEATTVQKGNRNDNDAIDADFETVTSKNKRKKNKKNQDQNTSDEDTNMNTDQTEENTAAANGPEKKASYTGTKAKKAYLPDLSISSSEEEEKVTRASVATTSDFSASSDDVDMQV